MSHWVVTVQLLGERRVALLFFKLLSSEVTVAVQLESGSLLVTQGKETALELQGIIGREDIKKSSGVFFLVIN